MVSDNGVIKALQCVNLLFEIMKTSSGILIRQGTLYQQCKQSVRTVHP